MFDIAEFWVLDSESIRGVGTWLKKGQNLMNLIPISRVWAIPLLNKPADFYSSLFVSQIESSLLSRILHIEFKIKSVILLLQTLFLKKPKKYNITLTRCFAWTCWMVQLCIVLLTMLIWPKSKCRAHLESQLRN